MQPTTTTPSPASGVRRRNTWPERRRVQVAADRAAQATSPSYAAAFAEKFIPEPNSGCWLWLGSVDANGYGRVRFAGASRLAHRVSLIIHRGINLGRLHALHRCDNPACVNPDHLMPGTNADNVQDMMRKGRNTVLRGPANPFAKLSREALLDVRARLVRGESHKSIAASYGLHPSRITRINAGQAYRGV